MNDATKETTPSPTVLIVGDPLNGFEYFGPFPSPAAALEYQETGLQDCRPSWAAPLLPDPLHADSSDSSGSSPPVLALLRELVAYEREAFENDEDVNGADTVAWLAEFRARCAEALQPAAGSSPRAWYACPDCGCTDITVDAAVALNTGDVLNVFDSPRYCSNCQREFDDAVEVDAEKREEDCHGN